MLAKLTLLAQLTTTPALYPASSPRAETRGPIAIPHVSVPVNASNDSILYTPVVVCESIAMNRQLSVEIIAHCAVNRVGWLKL